MTPLPEPKPYEAQGGEASALEAFRSYAKAFQQLDPGAIPAHFETPALASTPRGLLALSDAAAVERTYAGVMGDAKAKAYARSEFYDLTEQRLAAELSLVTGGCVWIDKSGQVIQRFGISYVLHRSQDTWRVVVALIHEPSSSGAATLAAV
jgi:hypothetical protein